ncbi:MAG: putative toxin-antitoxin system toxin component, PIN family [Bacteroidia bacterium]|nr:putative toxin-antitoxin system toxin component, PIN family [Bacteroidia bacterium]
MPEPAKVLLDTNIWISFSIGKQLAVLDRLFARPEFLLYTCEETIAEYQAVARRRKLRPYIPEARIAETLSLMAQCTTIVPRTTAMPPRTSRDPKDGFLLAAAFGLAADYLVTGDADLLVLDPYFRTRILKMGDFLRAAGLDPA